MRLIVLRIESTWSWLAAISSCESPPELAVWLIRFCSSVSRLLTSLRPPSAVPMMLPARPAFSMACWMPAFSARRFSEAIRPAGLSAPLLIFRPVLRRARLVLSELLFLRSTRCAISELTFVLIRLMGGLSVTETVARRAPPIQARLAVLPNYDARGLWLLALVRRVIPLTDVNQNMRTGGLKGRGPARPPWEMAPSLAA